MENRFVKERDLIYWVEHDRDYDGRFRKVVHKGYYLATYKFRDENIHIVTFGDITSCVIRHLKEDRIFLTKEEAQKRADELNAIRNEFGTEM